MTTEFGPELLRRALVTALFALKAHSRAIDDANVYPVPDGDTGTNMVLTLTAAVDALDCPDDEVFGSVARAALVGARGNSGVILAQILAGLLGSGTLDPKSLPAALARGADLAYGAVLEPVEGTILTVARAAAAGGSGDDVAAVLEGATAAAREALDKTPEQLEVLKNAGVLDAGGMGLWVILDAFAATASGRDSAPAPEHAAPRTHPREMGSGAFAYEVQYLLEAGDDTAHHLKSRLSALGDSVVVSGGAGLWNVHVHTNETAEAIRAGEESGRVSNTTVVAFEEQTSASPAARQIPVDRPQSGVAVVAVVAGEGMKSLYGRLGAGVLVDGGATMNPSVGELIDAITMAPAKDVLILPNNADAIPAALQACARSNGKRASVIETRDLAQGFTTMLAFGDARDFETNTEQMRRAATVATSAKVVVAARSGATPAGHARKGQWIGFVGEEPVLIEDDALAAVMALAKRLDTDEPTAALTLFAGRDASVEERERITKALRDALPGVEVESYDGGQPVERYLIAVE